MNLVDTTSVTFGFDSGDVFNNFILVDNSNGGTFDNDELFVNHCGAVVLSSILNIAGSGVNNKDKSVIITQHNLISLTHSFSRTQLLKIMYSKKEDTQYQHLEGLSKFKC